MTKLRYIFITLLVALLLTLPAVAAPQYIASIKQAPFHRLSCGWGRKIEEHNAVYYETREEAINDGHRPCKTCKP